MVWTKEQINKTKVDLEKARAFVQGLPQGLVREQLEPGLAAVGSAVVAAEAEAKASRGASGAPVVLHGDHKCLWKGKRTAEQRHVALVGSHLTVGQGNRIEEVINLRGRAAVSQGVAVAVWDGDAIVFRLWLPSAQEALRWALALDAAAQDEGAIDCSALLKLRMEKQRRAARRRRIGEGFSRFFARIAWVCEAHSGTEKWQLWQERGEEEKAALQPESAAGQRQVERQGSALTAVIGEVPILLKGMNNKELRHVAIDGDLLMIGREAWCTDESVSLNGTKVSAVGSMLSVWQDDKQLLRMRLEDAEEARRWASALQAAANLFARPAFASEAGGADDLASEVGSVAATPLSGEQALAAHAGLVLKAQRTSASLRDAPQEGSPNGNVNVRAGRYKVKSPAAVAESATVSRAVSVDEVPAEAVGA